jgi:hypothetical protein
MVRSRVVQLRAMVEGRGEAVKGAQSLRPPDH